MLWRLNHELLPDPGRPMARTTIPLLGWAGVAGALLTGALTTGSAATGSAAVVVKATAASPDFGLAPPRPRPPRPRRRRDGRASGRPFGATEARRSASG